MSNYNHSLRNSAMDNSPSSLEHTKNHLCPKCNQSFNVFTRKNFYVGKVPLILNCYHTLCEECITLSITNQKINCCVCNQTSTIINQKQCNLQEIFPVNFYILGLINYCKPNLKELSVLKLKPGVKYSEHTQSQSNSSIANATDFLLQAPVQEKCSQVGCKKSANVHCIECDELYCTHCSDTLHRSARGLKTHKIASLTDFVPRLTSKCNVHRDHFLEVFCNTCNRIACCDCIVEEHNGHNFYKLSDLNLLGDFNLNELVAKAEEKLKHLMQAHKKALSKLEHSIKPHETIQVETAIGKIFSRAHAKLQLLEEKFRNDVEEFKNQNNFVLNDITQELSLNIRKLNSLIGSVKSINTPYQENKYDIRAITESLENALSLPCYLVGEPHNTNDIQFEYEDLICHLDDYFSLKYEDNPNKFRLVTENELPEDYNMSLPYDVPSDMAADSLSSISSQSLSSVQLNDSLMNLSTNNTNFNQIEGWIANAHNGIPTTGVRENVIVSHIDSPECFYIQFNRLEDTFRSVCLEIQRQSQAYFAPAKNIELNKLYIVKFESSWYRARVINVKRLPNGTQLYTVFFIDYGNTSTVTSNSILNISNDLLFHNPFAYKCKLFHTYPVGEAWDDKATLHMAKIVNNANIVMITMGQQNNVLEVDLLSVSNTQTTSIRDALIFVGLAAPDLEMPKQLKNSKSKHNIKLHGRNDKFRNGDSLMVIICNVINPFSLYVQIADFVHHLERLTFSMNNHYNKKRIKESQHGQYKNEHIYVPRKGMVIAVQIDSTWYRATISGVIKGEGIVTAFLEDYGKSVSVNYTAIRKLSERFKTLECQAIHVRLADVKPKQKNWDVKATEFFDQFVQGKKVFRLVIVDAEHVPSVALYERFETMDVCINTALVEEGFAVSSGETTKSLQYLYENEPSSSKENAYVFELLDTIQCVKSNEESNSDSEQENVIRKPVKVLSVKSPAEIFVEIEDPEVQKMQYEIHKSMQEYYSKEKRESKYWNASDPCAAYHPLKKQFFRGIILEKISENFKIMLKDIAEEIILPEKNLFILQNQFKQFREKAIRCHLANIFPAGDKNKWSGLAVDFLEKVFEKHNKIFMTKSGPVDRNRKSVPVVMWYSETKLEGPLEPSKTVLCNINKLLVRKGLAFKEKVDCSKKENEKSPSQHLQTSERPKFLGRSIENICTSVSPIMSNQARNESSDVEQHNDSAQASPSTASMKTKELTDDTNINDKLPIIELSDWQPPVPFKTKNFLAIATFVDYSACIYIHESIKEPVLRKMEDEMKNYFSDTPPEPLDTVWIPGQLCTVKYFVNDNWYRGKIISVGDDDITVFLIDYGNEEECKHEDLRLKVMYLDLPAFANKIRLHQVYPKSGSAWLTSDLDELHRRIVENEIHVIIKTLAENNLPSSAVLKLNGENINRYMIDYSSNLISTDTADDASESDDDVIIEHEKLLYEDIVSKTVDTNGNYVQNSISDSLIGQTINVTVISIINYNEFILEILINQNISETKRLFKKISSDISEKAEQQPLLTEFKVGKPCIAKFSEDGKWYRGEILDTKNLDSGMVHIWFVDYGNSENVSIEFVRRLLPNWLELPILQYRAKIDGLLLSDPSCLDLVLECMADYCNTVKSAEIVSVNPLCVKLFDNNELIYQDLIDQQLLITTN